MALRLLKNVQAALGRIEEALAMMLVAALLIVVNLQIFARYVFHHPFIWPEEISRLVLVWITFISAAALARIGGDLAVDTFIEMLPHRAKRVALIVRDAMMLVVFAVVMLEAAALAEAVNNMPLVATGLPTSLLAWPAILGGGLIVFHCFIRLVVSFASPAEEVPHTPKVMT
jgi:TRAP-type C4-dicarboxylate transport system permease small subunit